MTKQERNEMYLERMYQLLRRPERWETRSIKSQFNNSEMRLLGEIIKEEKEGRKIISTELADRLGVTRSAISQIVKKLEKNGVLVRTPSLTDKKSSYVQLSDNAKEIYRKEFEESCEAMGELVERFGKEKFEKLIALNEELFALIEKRKK